MKFRNIIIGGLALLTVANAIGQVKADTTFRSNGNPIIRHEYTADPAAMVYKGKVYLYTGHDEAPTRRDQYVMHNWTCFSSSDMVNWTEYKKPLTEKILPGQRMMHGHRR